LNVGWQYSATVLIPLGRCPPWRSAGIDCDQPPWPGLGRRDEKRQTSSANRFDDAVVNVADAWLRRYIMRPCMLPYLVSQARRHGDERKLPQTRTSSFRLQRKNDGSPRILPLRTPRINRGGPAPAARLLRDVEVIAHVTTERAVSAASSGKFPVPP
jgi:hypothetical protein